MNRKRVILAVLLAVLALCLVYAYREMPRLEQAPPRESVARTKPAGRTDARSAAEAAGRIRFAMADEEPKPFDGATRDIFRFGRLPRHTGDTAGKPSAPPLIEAEPETPSPDLIPFAVVQEELSKFTFLGFLEKAGEKTVFLSSGGSLFVAKRNETFGLQGEFTVEAIDGNLLKVRRANHENLIEIPLMEKQKLAATVSAPARLAPLGGPTGAMPLRTFAPRPRPAQPFDGTAAEVSEPVVEEENNPPELQESQPPAEGEAIEGEVNGKKQ